MMRISSKVVSAFVGGALVFSVIAMSTVQPVMAVAPSQPAAAITASGVTPQWWMALAGSAVAGGVGGAATTATVAWLGLPVTGPAVTVAALGGAAGGAAAYVVYSGWTAAFGNTAPGTASSQVSSSAFDH
jgi:hypothetical protein